jgi:hypothetical protein
MKVYRCVRNKRIYNPLIIKIIMEKLIPSIEELREKYKDVMNNSAVTSICNMYKTIYSNETPNPDSPKEEAKYLARALENVKKSKGLIKRVLDL